MSGPGDASNIRDGRRIAWGKQQRQQCRNRRRHQSGQQDPNPLHRPGNTITHHDVDPGRDEQGHKSRGARRASSGEFSFFSFDEDLERTL